MVREDRRVRAHHPRILAVDHDPLRRVRGPARVDVPSCGQVRTDVVGRRSPAHRRDEATASLSASTRAAEMLSLPPSGFTRRARPRPTTSARVAEQREHPLRPLDRLRRRHARDPENGRRDQERDHRRDAVVRGSLMDGKSESKLASSCGSATARQPGREKEEEEEWQRRARRGRRRRAPRGAPTRSLPDRVKSVRTTPAAIHRHRRRSRRTRSSSPAKAGTTT